MNKAEQLCKFYSLDPVFYLNKYVNDVAHFNYVTRIKMAYKKSKPFDKVEVLSGKVMTPTHGNNKTILFGQCQNNLNKDHPDIKELITIPGCPPSKEAIQDALQQIGLRVPKSFWAGLDKAPGWLMQKYKGKPEFEESFFQIK